MDAQLSDLSLPTEDSQQSLETEVTSSHSETREDQEERRIHKEDETNGTGSCTCTFTKTRRRFSMENVTTFSFHRRARADSQFSTIEDHDIDFWVRHFPKRNDVPWEEFRSAFIQDYGTYILEFAPCRLNWIMSILQMDIFQGREYIYKMHYDAYCGKSNANPDKLWMKVKKYASERIFREGVVESMFE